VIGMSPRDRLRRLGRALAPWIDPTTRRPLVLLAAVALGAVLGPLGVDLFRAAFYRLPYATRWWVGEALFLALVGLGLRRLLTVRPGDAWPATDDAGASPSRADRLVPWALRLATASLVVPLLSHPDGFGFADWDFVLDKFEAARVTIARFGQFPWWNPWIRGGFPLAANPQIGAVSMATPLVLALGTVPGLAVATALCLLIAVEGAYRLAFAWLREPFGAATAALLYGLNGGVIVNTAWGYVLPMSYASLPWLALGAFRLERRPRDGVALGFWLAFTVLNGVQYVNLYAGLLMGAIVVRALARAGRDGRLRLLRHGAIALGTALALCGWRLFTLLLVLREDGREAITSWSETPTAMLHYLLRRPPADWPTAIPVPHVATFVELTCYAGPVALGLVALSLRWGWRWWHALAALGLLFAMGSREVVHPSYWTSTWPLFASTHVVTRWRFPAMLGIGLAAGSVVARGRVASSPAGRALATAAALAVAADLVLLAHQQLPLAFSLRPTADLDPGPPVPTIVTLRSGLGFACTREGYGLVEGYEPMVGGYRRDAPTLRRARTDPDYRGEAWTDSGPVAPVAWTPNRIVFRLAPHQTLYLNQNPGSWWLANGVRPFPTLPCASLREPFAVRADARGHLELRVRPPYLAAALALHPIGLALAWLAARRGRGRPPEEPV
jgi:hypothetical protein